jgi:hypothetical protein
MVVGLLAAAAPAMAQYLDPLSLISSGAVLPYFADSGKPDAAVDTSGNISILEAYAPVGIPFVNVGSPRFHMFFFDEACTRSGPSVGLPLTVNDVEFLVVNAVKGNAVDGDRPTNGLIAAAAVNNDGFRLEPLDTFDSVHLKVLWFNVAKDFGRTLEPIAIGAFETFGAIPWNPLRTGATFWAPLEQTGVATTIYFICPDDNIAGKTALAFPESRFPALVPAATVHSHTTSLAMRVYDDQERFLRNVHSTCSCLSTRPLAAVDPIFKDAHEAPNGTYSEVEANDGARSVSFTGYRAIQLGAPTPSIEIFGRLNNGWRCALNQFDSVCLAEFTNLGTTR